MISSSKWIKSDETCPFHNSFGQKSSSSKWLLVEICFFLFFKKHRFHVLHFPNSTGLFAQPTGRRHHTKHWFSPRTLPGCSFTLESPWPSHCSFIYPSWHWYVPQCSASVDPVALWSQKLWQWHRLDLGAPHKPTEASQACTRLCLI